nr:MAG TPA_asm: hypothetical protein [Caudoviricetes sp.]
MHAWPLGFCCAWHLVAPRGGAMTRGAAIAPGLGNSSPVNLVYAPTTPNWGSKNNVGNGLFYRTGV